MKDLIGRLTNRLGLQRRQVEKTIELFDDGSTVPFVARYRKEVTGGLDDAKLAEFRARLDELRRLEDRQEAVIESIEAQGRLTPVIASQIEEAETLQEVEDLYLPYKLKRRTRAQVAREAGLEPLAAWIMEQAVFDVATDDAAAPYLSGAFQTPTDAWRGACDIVAEAVARDARARGAARDLTWRTGILRSSVREEIEDDKHTYAMYYEFASRLQSIKPHQVLAVSRGESEGVLRVTFEAEDGAVLAALQKLFPTNVHSPLCDELEHSIIDANTRLIGPAVERDIRSELKRWADEHAINVFATNLRNLLLTPPLKGTTVLGIDPGFRTGCKLAVVDSTGRVLYTGTVYPHDPQRDWLGAQTHVRNLINKYEITLISIGNGTASRETEELAAAVIESGALARYLVVNEAGASVYSASPLARAELPDLDVSLRGAVSIARRAQDPLAELVKIDPQSIGIGMYQHDVDQVALATALEQVIENVVNSVGVDVNTASPSLLSHIAGISPKLAEKLVRFRDRIGRFESRQDLLGVPGMGEKTYQQAAGFLRISGGTNLLDNTGVHPESYNAVAILLDLLDLDLEDSSLAKHIDNALAEHGLHNLANLVGVGEPTMEDILFNLKQPGRDPRDEAPPPILREDITTIEDLHPGMRLKGTVRNVVDFGAFVDIGVKADGLIHISEMASYRVESPYEVVGAGDVVEVTVLHVDPSRGRIALSLRSTT